jgi:hypothetical protein
MIGAAAIALQRRDIDGISRSADEMELCESDLKFQEIAAARGHHLKTRRCFGRSSPDAARSGARTK